MLPHLSRQRASGRDQETVCKDAVLMRFEATRNLWTDYALREVLG
jgi:hypothetical protein